jgi:5-oxoprolinase (ATP-hydrolysing)
MVNMSDLSGVRIAVDRGGTFCDLFAYIPQWMYRPPPPSLIGDATIILPEQDDEDQGVQVQMKLLSVDPANYQDAPAEGIRRIMQIVQGKEIRKGVKIDTTGVDSVRMGTTVATNA